MRTTMLSRKRLLTSALFVALAAGCHGAKDAPSSVTVDVQPDADFYPVASDVSVIATVTDSAGKPLSSEKVKWTVSPADAATPSGTAGSYTLQKPGPLTFTACTVDEASDGHLKCGEAVIVVAPSAPVLRLTKPLPGDEVGGDGKSTYTVAGTVTTGRPAQVFVNGAPTTVADDGSFTTEVPAFFGANHLVVSATDGENPEVRDELDVAYGASYLPAVDASGAPSFSAPDAIVLDLGQRFFDDGTTVPLDAPHPVTLPTLANIVTRLVSGLDVLSKIPNPILASSNANLTATSVTIDGVDVEVSIAPDGLDLFVHVDNVSVGTTGSLQISSTSISLDGGVKASLSAYVHASITKASPTDPVVVTVDSPQVVLETATGAFTDPQGFAVFALASGSLRATVQTTLQNALSSTLQGSIPQALENVFQSLDSALANHTFTINTPPLPAVGLTLDGHLDELDIAPLDSLRAKLSLAVKTDHTTAVHPGSRGVALIDTSTDDPLFVSPRTQLSVRLSVLNGLSHNLWNSGLLEIPVSSIRYRSPSRRSCLRSCACRGGRNGRSRRLPRRFRLVPQGDDANGRLGVLIESGLNIDLANDTLSLTLAKTPTVKVWIITPPQGLSIYTPDVLTGLLQTTLWPKLSDGISSALAIKLPLPPLDALSTLAPSLAGLTLTTGLNGRLAYRDGFLVLDAKLEGTLP